MEQCARLEEPSQLLSHPPHVAFILPHLNASFVHLHILTSVFFALQPSRLHTYFTTRHVSHFAQRLRILSVAQICSPLCLDDMRVPRGLLRLTPFHSALPLHLHGKAFVREFHAVIADARRRLQPPRVITTVLLYANTHSYLLLHRHAIFSCFVLWHPAHAHFQLLCVVCLQTLQGLVVFTKAQRCLCISPPLVNGTPTTL